MARPVKHVTLETFKWVATRDGPALDCDVSVEFRGPLTLKGSMYLRSVDGRFVRWGSFRGDLYDAQMNGVLDDEGERAILDQLYRLISYEHPRPRTSWARLLEDETF